MIELPQDDKPIRGDILKDALKQFDYLGISVRDLLIEDIENHGIVLDDNHYYSLKDIEKRFASLFGNDITPLLVERLRKILGGFKMLAIASIPTVQYGFICITASCVCFICNCLGMMQTM